MKKAAKGVTKSIETITDTATTCGNAIASMFLIWDRMIWQTA